MRTAASTRRLSKAGVLLSATFGRSATRNHRPKANLCRSSLGVSHHSARGRAPTLRPARSLKFGRIVQSSGDLWRWRINTDDQVERTRRDRQPVGFAVGTRVLALHIECERAAGVSRELVVAAQDVAIDRIGHGVTSGAQQSAFAYVAACNASEDTQLLGCTSPSGFPLPPGDSSAAATTDKALAGSALADSAPAINPRRLISRPLAIVLFIFLPGIKDQRSSRDRPRAIAPFAAFPPAG
jgi:hypothetical protein